jgi:hypothetical protein
MPDEFVEGDLRKYDLWDIWVNPDSFSYNRKFDPEQLGPTVVHMTKKQIARAAVLSIRMLQQEFCITIHTVST